LVGGQLPDRDQLALYGGLGAAAVIGMIDWPVAAAVAAGTLVARRARRSSGSRAKSSGTAAEGKAS